LTNGVDGSRREIRIPQPEGLKASATKNHGGNPHKDTRRTAGAKIAHFSSHHVHGIPFGGGPLQRVAGLIDKGALSDGTFSGMIPGTLKRDSDYLQFRPYRAITAPPIRGKPAPISAGRTAIVDLRLSPVSEIKPRSRLLYAALGAGVIGLGLLWRSPFLGFSHFITKYGGSALWALLVFLCCGLVKARASTWRLVFAATVISFCVEFSQLYHAPWIDQIRAHRLGGLILGSTFSSYDLIAYLVGIGAGAILEVILRKRDALAR